MIQLVRTQLKHTSLQHRTDPLPTDLEATGSYGLAWGLAILLVAIVASQRTPEIVVLYAAFAGWWLIFWLLHALWAPAATLWLLFGWTVPVVLSLWRTVARGAD